MAEQDFLARIRATEKQAADLVEQARSTARLKLDEARDRASELIGQARIEASQLQQAAIEAATVEAEQLLNVSAQHTRDTIDQLKTETIGRLEQAAARLAERIVSDHGNR